MNSNGTVTMAVMPGNYHLQVEPQTKDILTTYLEQRRRALITELREVERLLNVKQSIPKRKRS